MLHQSKFVLCSIFLAILLQGCDAPKLPKHSLKNRTAQYSIVSSRLASLSDQQLEELLKTAKLLSVGYGENVELSVDGIPVFIKKIPLTDLERRPENISSTANIFNLPLFYQYGVGSAGFGAWRELEANITATNWVLTDQCPNFPIMYHWRVLPGSIPQAEKDKKIKKLEKHVAWWNNSAEVGARFEALNNATAFVVIFLESIPETVDDFLDKKFKEGQKAFDCAVTMVDQNLESTTTFMMRHGMYHFDAHFHNILTDGYQLYFADMGLSACSTFDLSSDEKTFFEQHTLYDRCFVRSDLVWKIVGELIADEADQTKLVQEYAQGKQDQFFSPTVTAILKKHSKSALVFDEFIVQLRKVSKLTPYPAVKIEELCKD